MICVILECLRLEISYQRPATHVTDKQPNMHDSLRLLFLKPPKMSAPKCSNPPDLKKLVCLKCYMRGNFLLSTSKENYCYNDPWKLIESVFCPNGVQSASARPEGVIPFDFFTLHKLSWNYIGRRMKNISLFLQVFRTIINANSLEDIDFLFEQSLLGGKNEMKISGGQGQNPGKGGMGLYYFKILSISYQN